MAGTKLPILTLPVTEQRYSCHGCGNCCRDFSVQLRDDDIARLEAQGWDRILGEPVTVTFRGTTFLRQRPDGACVFLLDDGRCRIHAEHGFEEKPVACQMFPFSLTPAEDGALMGVNFACQSVLESRGAGLRTHVGELRRMAARLPEVRRATALPALADRRQATRGELRALRVHLDTWMTREDQALDVRLDGLAWIAQSLAKARLDAVRDKRFAELLDLLFGAMPEELACLPIDPATNRQRKMLRHAVFTRVEAPQLAVLARRGRWRSIVSQLRRGRRYKSGRGRAPCIGFGWPDDARLEAVESVRGATASADRTAVEDLIGRYVRAAVLGGRAWGQGYYGWPVTWGVAALVLNVAAAGWLARLHAVGAGREAITTEDMYAALGRVDRTAGRARWLGSPGERLRLRYLAADDSLRRCLAAYPVLAPE